MIASVIRHAPGSQAEGKPARIRVYTPKYLFYVSASDSLQTNYTSGYRVIHPPMTPNSTDVS